MLYYQIKFKFNLEAIFRKAFQAKFGYEHDDGKSLILP